MKQHLVVVVIAGWLGMAAGAGAQEPPPAPQPKPAEEPKEPEKKPPPPPAHTGVKATLKAIPKDFASIPSLDTLMVLGVGAPVTWGVHFGDKTVNAHLKGSTFTHDFFWLGKIIGQTETQLAIALGTYAVARATNHPHASHLGMDLVRASIEVSLLTVGLKEVFRRQRPDGSSGFAFPSGHASSTFAAATILERHLRWLAAVPTYAIATYVATSRLHENRHYLSDVAAGATLGIIVGRTIVHTHGRTNWGFMMVPIPQGAAFVVTRVPPATRPPS